MLTPFHVALQVRDLEEARRFYGGVLRLEEGRSSESWIDYNMYGHQFVVHYNSAIGKDGQIPRVENPVDQKQVPVPHCGVVLPYEEWQQLADYLVGVIDHFIIEPYLRFRGQPGEQGTMFFQDPSGNCLEFKTFGDIDAQLFEKNLPHT